MKYVSLLVTGANGTEFFDLSSYTIQSERRCDAGGCFAEGCKVTLEGESLVTCQNPTPTFHEAKVYYDNLVVASPSGCDPTIHCPTEVRVANDSGKRTAAVSYAVTTKGCSEATLACMPFSGSTFGAGTTTVHCTATDAFGRTAECSFLVTVEDREAPRIVCPANSVTNAAPGRSSQTVSFEPVVVDNGDTPPGSASLDLIYVSNLGDNAILGFDSNGANLCGEQREQHGGKV